MRPAYMADLPAHENALPVVFVMNNENIPIAMRAKLREYQYRMSDLDLEYDRMNRIEEKANKTVAVPTTTCLSKVAPTPWIKKIGVMP
jgi:hypothetical protein